MFIENGAFFAHADETMRWAICKNYFIKDHSSHFFLLSFLRFQAVWAGCQGFIKIDRWYIWNKKMDNRLVHSIIIVYLLFCSLHVLNSWQVSQLQLPICISSLMFFISPLWSKICSKMFTGCCFIKLYSNFFETFLLSV